MENELTLLLYFFFMFLFTLWKLVFVSFAVYNKYFMINPLLPRRILSYFAEFPTRWTSLIYRQLLIIPIITVQDKNRCVSV